MRNHPSSATGLSFGLLASLVVAGATLAPAPALAQDGAQEAVEEPTSTRGERVPEAAFGEWRIVDVRALHREQAAQPHEQEFVHRMRNSSHGVWAVPSASSLQPAHSGDYYIINKWGDTSMGIGFPQLVDLDGVWVSGQSDPAVWTKRLRVVGYRDGVEVARTDWNTAIGERHTWFDIGLEDVDRVVFEAEAAVRGAAWYALDDLTYTPVAVDGAPAQTVVLDFDDLGYKHKLTGSDYRGLEWEAGTGDFEVGIEAVDQPLTRNPGVKPQTPSSTTTTQSLGGAGTAPTPGRDFRGARLFDPGANFIPPDTCGAATMNHIVETTNANFSVFTKNGTRVIDISQQSLFGIGSAPGDARVVYDPHSGRTIVISTDFGSRCYLAVSSTSDPTGTYFATSFVVTQGVDSNHFPDYPTLGVDEDGIYIEFAMFPNSGSVTMSIFVLDKAPLVAGSQSLGAITAFRNLPWRGAMQPCVTYGTPGPEYIIHYQGNNELRIRTITGPRNSPTLTTLGDVSVPIFFPPPDVPSLGASVPLDSVDDRLMNAVYRNGRIWTTHSINVNGRAAVRWYEINPNTLSTVQVGTIQDSELGFIMPSLSVNANNDMLIGFSGSSANQFPGAYACGRAASDIAGQTSPPVQYKNGGNSYQNLDNVGRNRWGDYSLTYVDPADDLTFWTLQEYSQNTANRWSTWIAEYSYSGIIDCNNNGVDDADDISNGTSQDCNLTGIPDECELAGNDCDSNGVPDECDPDCDLDGLPDDCETDCNSNGTPDDCEGGPDCNGNDIPDECELTNNDCNSNGVPDDCELPGNDCNLTGILDECEAVGNDCNNNQVPDECDPDCDLDGLPDDCEADCDGDGQPDDCEPGPDCNNNDIPDVCEPDCDGDGQPDDCEPDCDNDGTPDDCEGGPDCNSNGIPDECELAGNDCNSNSVPDDCEADCDGDGTPDDCELAGNDCNTNGVPDDCELSGNDCNTNGIPDDCELAGNDCNSNGTPDECEADCDTDGTPDDCEPDCDTDGVPDDCEDDCNSNGTPDDCEAFTDCNSNGVPDECDIASGTSDDSDGNSVPDECEFLGSVYCVGAPNSAGPGAEMRALGSDVVADNDFRLRSESLPPSVFGLHFYGPTQVQTPFGDGFRCVGGATQRIQPANQANPSGVINRQVDLTLPPVASLAPGTTWNFQLWYRDPMGPGGTGFNLTQGVEVDFQ